MPSGCGLLEKEGWEDMASGKTRSINDKYGYDTKFAMHYIRWLYEPKELLSDKPLTLPLCEKDLLIKIRRGGYEGKEVLALGVEPDEEGQDLLRASDLAEEPNRQLLSNVIAKAYREHWDRQA